MSKVPISIVSTMGAQIVVVILSAWFVADDKVTGGVGVERLLIEILGFPLLGIVGLIQAIRFLRKKIYPFPTLCLGHDTFEKTMYWNDIAA